MYLDLRGEWELTLDAEEGEQKAKIQLPGTLQAAGFGNEINKHTPWVSSLHDESWYEREEYRYGAEHNFVPFLAQPRKHFLGEASYEKHFEITQEEKQTWVFYIEIVHWKTTVYMDGELVGTDCSLCTAHEIDCGYLTKGSHTIRVIVDNTMQYPYRPDGHGVSDALAATWNGMLGEIALFTQTKRKQRMEEKKNYAKQHPRQIAIQDGKFMIDGKPEYFRGTHLGGQYPLTGYPDTSVAFWKEKFQIIKDWGFNFARCHSFCPPEAAFLAADEVGIYLQPECGMWNHFEPDIEMLNVLKQESQRILQQFGHHPSFVLFSSTNEPDGDWYQVLRQWTADMKAFDEKLGYKGRRVYTAQSGWFYEVAPSQVEGTDYLYFHRSNFGPLFGGNIRGVQGWRGKDYEPSIENVTKPVICHELGQWCAYPDFSVIEKFTGQLVAGNYRNFMEHARRQGVLHLKDQFVAASGRNQLRLYKEDVEANLRTPGMYGFELLDLHDYLGQGTAVVGLLDAFWQEKGYASAQEFRQFCDTTVILARIDGYVHSNQEILHIPVELCHFGTAPLEHKTLKWVYEIVTSKQQSERVCLTGEIALASVLIGKNQKLGSIELPLHTIAGHQTTRLRMEIEGVTRNEWTIYVYDQAEIEAKEKKERIDIFETQDWSQAYRWLQEGKRVLFSPKLSAMGYECPPVSMKNVFWNAQMGPTWGRSLGLMIEASHAVFSNFPTAKDGGWQWEDIVEQARAFCIQKFPKEFTPIVRVIDDWNRNLSLALLFEVKVGAGTLFFSSISFTRTQTLAHRVLKQAIYDYMASDAFQPAFQMQAQKLDALISAQLFPTLGMEKLAKHFAFDQDALLQGEAYLGLANPNQSVHIEKENYPITITIQLKQKEKVNGLLYVPEQRGRTRRGYVKKYEIRQWKQDSWCPMVQGELRNCSYSQKIMFPETMTIDRIQFVILESYGVQVETVWYTDKEGWQKVQRTKKAVADIACLSFLFAQPRQELDEDILFWAGEQSSKTKEIEQ